MKKFTFNNVESLAQFLANNGTYTFYSKVKKLTKIDVLLMCLASGDFNPAHCRPEFAEHSIFKARVSHGVGTLARAEAEFLQGMQFNDIPVEVIALGLESRYRAALPVGSKYYYTYTISNMVSKKNRWDMDCQISCTVINADGTEKLIMDEVWHPSFVDHRNSVSVEKLNLLKPKSYWGNVMDIFVAAPMRFFADYLLLGTGTLALASTGYFFARVVAQAIWGIPMPTHGPDFGYCM